MDGIFLHRVLICYVLSMLIGFERLYRNKATGLRTNALVALGSFLFVYVSVGDVSTDKFRIASQVVCGMGFLGAGIILRNGNKVRGLNTAATLWTVAAIGVLCAYGFIPEAVVGTFLILFSNVLLRDVSSKIIEKIQNNSKEKCIIDVTCDDAIEVVVRTLITENIEKNSIQMESLNRNKGNDKNVKLRFEFITSRPELIMDLVNKLSEEVGVHKVNWSHKRMVEIHEDDDDEYEEDDD
ncbi:MAG: MgtC/SapB family protein [Bacilli bacterium]|nr:MgtC/SapB family protein [Bacilli bacterium]